MNSLGLFSLLTLRSPHIPAGQSWPGTRTGNTWNIYKPLTPPWRFCFSFPGTQPTCLEFSELRRWCYVGKVGRARLEGDLQVSRAGVLRVPGTMDDCPRFMWARGRGTPGHLSGAPASALVSIAHVTAPLRQARVTQSLVRNRQEVTSRSHMPRKQQD